jgi:virulence factor Mce-like protein
MARESFGQLVKRRSLGVVLIAVVVGLISLSIAFFNKDFTKVVMIQLNTDHTGNQLDPSSDVKVRGILVGEVRSIKSVGDGAVIKLAITPSMVKLIPQNVTAEILPKTLFGERFVDLELPSSNPGPPVNKHTVIQQDRSSAAIQFAEVLNNLLPVLQALKPAELNATLNALAGALKGRGTQLGDTIVQTDAYLAKINPQIPQLVQDLNKLGSVANEYNAAAPALLDTLTNLQTTSATITQNKDNLSNLLLSATGASDALNGLLTADGAHIIDVTAQTNQVAALLDKYSPEYQCFLAGLAKAEPEFVQLFRNGELHVQISLVQNRGKYVPGNEPTLETGVAPGCYGLPNAQVPFQISPYYSILNEGAGYCATTAQDASVATSPQCQQAGATGQSEDQSEVGSDSESALINTLISGDYGTSPQNVPPIATILAGPLLRGSAVTLK